MVLEGTDTPGTKFQRPTVSPQSAAPASQGQLVDRLHGGWENGLLEAFRSPKSVLRNFPYKRISKVPKSQDGSISTEFAKGLACLLSPLACNLKFIILTIILSGLVAGYVFLSYRSLLVYSIIYAAAASRDAKKFFPALFLQIGYAVGISAVVLLRGFVSGAMSVLIRDELDTMLTREYLDCLQIYSLKTGKNALTHPEQRLALDIEKFSMSIMEIIAGKDAIGGLLQSVGTLCYYIPIVYGGLEYVGVGAILTWSLFFCVVGSMVLNWTASWSYLVEHFKTIYRHLHYFLRSNIESAVFYGDLRYEIGLIRAIFRTITTLETGLYLSKTVLNAMQTIFSSCTSALSLTVIFLSMNTLPHIKGAPQSEKIAWVYKYNYSTYTLFISFADIYNLDERIMLLTTYTVRIYELHQSLNIKKTSSSSVARPDYDLSSTPSSSMGIITGSVLYQDAHLCITEADLCVEKLNVYNESTGALLLENVNFSVTVGGSLLITGPSGVGKTSILKTLICPSAYDPDSPTQTNELDSLVLPPTIRSSLLISKKVFFISQKPYIPLGLSLFQQVTYPKVPVILTLEDQAYIRQLISDVGLGYLLERMDACTNEIDAVDWNNILSLGELQKLCIARILWSRPNFVFLDESTSNLDLESEKIVYGFLRKAGVGIISIGHRSSLLDYHDRTLNVLSFKKKLHASS